jgi:hypothetical protein
VQVGDNWYLAIIGPQPVPNISIYLFTGVVSEFLNGTTEIVSCTRLSKIIFDLFLSTVTLFFIFYRGGVNKHK